MRNLLLVICVLGLVACKQDPLEGYPEEVRKGIPPHEKPIDNRPAVPRDAMVIEMKPGVANFTEGAEGQVIFEGRLLGYEGEFALRAQNLPPGATFDESTGTLTWTPPNNFVYGFSHYRSWNIEITMYTLEKPIVSIVETFTLNIYRQIDRPEILQATDINPIVEGNSTNFKIAVRDPDSIDSSGVGVNPPTLTVVTTNKSYDGSPFVRLAQPGIGDTNPKQDPNDPEVWWFSMVVDLKGVEATNTKKDLAFGVVATSAFMVPSQMKEIVFNVVTSTSDPIITWEPDGEIEINEGETFKALFHVYSEKGDGSISVKWNPLCSTLPGKTVCKCEKVGYSNQSRMRCSFQWTPEQPTRDRYSIEIEAQNSSLVGLTSVMYARVTQKFKVKKRPAPPPAPQEPQSGGLQ